MKAILYVESPGGPVEEFGVRVEDRAYYVPVLQSAAQYCVKQIEDTDKNDSSESIQFFVSRLSNIEEFLDNYNPQVQDPNRHFDLTYAEAAYVSKRVAEKRALACEFTGVLAAKNIFGMNLDKSLHTRDEYAKYKSDRCIEVVRENVGAAAVADVVDMSLPAAAPALKEAA